VKIQFSSEPYWYVIYTFPHFEKKVHLALLNANIVNYLPLQRVVRQWSDRIKKVERALFPNYLFVQMPIQEKYKVLTIYGVSRFVCFGGNPAIVTDEEICIIKQLIIDPGLRVEQDIVHGDIVTITDGPFKGLTGSVFERKGKTRLCIRIKTIKQILSVEVPLSIIKKLEPIHRV